MARKDELGRHGESLAADYLTAQGMELIDRNWRCSAGEIDLILRDGPHLVFAEVKTRSSTRYGHPLEAITNTKLARMRRLAHSWCIDHEMRAPIRLDAIAVIVSRSGPTTIEHLRDVF
jgi:putative endonuclease